MKIKRLLTICFLLALTVIVATLNRPITTEAATYDGFTITVSGGKATITDYTGSATDLPIPSTLGGYPVTAIGDLAFEGCSSLTSVVIPDSVTTIGAQVFFSCSSLISVTIPDSVTTINGMAFDHCEGLKGIWVDEDNADYSSDERGVLFNKNKTRLMRAPGAIVGSYTVPDSVTVIDDAFRDCSGLTSVTIGDNVTHIESYAFHSCNSLTGIWVNSKNRVFSSDSYGVLFDKDKTTLLKAPGGFSGTYIIPDGVTTIADSAFSDCDNLYSVTIPEGVISIGQSAFYHCNRLISISVPDSVTTIGNYAFSSCYNLKSAIIGNGVTTINKRLFTDCFELTNVIIGGSVTSISEDVFYNCNSLNSVTMGEKITTIGDDAFARCNGLVDVYYAGRQSQWEAISIGTENSYLTDATIHYQHVHDYTLLPPEKAEPTCTEDGYIEYICAYGDTYREILPALGHCVGSDGVVTPPTCTEQGYTTTTCPRCSQVVELNYAAAVGHDYSGTVTVVPPTCTEQGYTITQCVRCDSTQNSDYTEALDHDYSGTVTVIAPTCADQGYTQTQCVRCDSIAVSDYTETVAHKMILVPAVAPTCTEPGLTVGTKCQWCGMVGVAQKEVAATGNHDYTANPTTCGACGFVRAELGITSVVLRPTVSGIYFKGAFTLGEGVTAQRYGIAVSTENAAPVADDSDPTCLYTNGYNSALIKNILDSSNGKTVIYARAYILLEDGTYIYGEVVETSLYQVVLAVDSSWDSLTEAQKSAIMDMYDSFVSTMQIWALPNIKGNAIAA